MLIFDIQVINLQYLVQAWNCNATMQNEYPRKLRYKYDKNKHYIAMKYQVRKPQTPSLQGNITLLSSCF